MKMQYIYIPEGVCSTEMVFEIDNNIIKSVKIKNGCNGNLQGISKLLIGMDIDEVISKLRGIKCGFKDTSCPDQIAKGLEEFKSSR